MSEATDDQRIGQAVRAAREAAGLSGRKLADQLGIDAASWGKVERGERALRVAELIRTADLLGLSLDELVQRPGDAELVARRMVEKSATEATEALLTLARALDRRAEVNGQSPDIPEAGATERQVWVGQGRSIPLREALHGLVDLLSIHELAPFTGLDDSPALPGSAN